jgi:hypothetical protein
VKNFQSKSFRRQSGVTTLAISLMLLAILTVAALFAASFGVFEQRTAGSEYRHKLAFQAAEAGLNQSVEYIKANAGLLLSDDGTEGGWFAGGMRWQPCSQPKPASMLVDPCQAEPASRRASMYRYVGPNQTGDGTLPLGEIFPGQQTFNVAGGTGVAGGKFATRYDTYAALCRLDMTNPAAPVCALTGGRDGSLSITLVSRGQLTDESADAIVKQSFGTYRTIGRGPDAPLIAASSAGAGNAQIVPNHAAGEPDYPGQKPSGILSIWAAGDADISSGASFATCRFWAWADNFDSGEPTTALQRDQNGVCFTCSCNDLCPKGLISGNASSCGVTPNFLEGEDILDVDGGKSDAEIPRRDSSYFPQDLFAYTFGIPSSSADSYLADEATSISNCGSSELNADSGGLYWYANPEISGLAPPLATCVLDGSQLPPGSPLYPGNRKQVGTLKHPVVLVSDGPVRLNAGVIFYGVIYIRSKAGTGNLLDASGSPQVYGAVVLEGDATIAGSPMLVYNQKVLDNIMNSPAFLHLAPVAGSWSDDVQR